MAIILQRCVLGDDDVSTQIRSLKLICIFASTIANATLGCTQSLSFLVHSNWGTGASERHSRAKNGEEGRKIRNANEKVAVPSFSLPSSPFSAQRSTSLTPVSQTVVHLACSSFSITKTKETDCVQSNYHLPTRARSDFLPLLRSHSLRHNILPTSLCARDGDERSHLLSLHPG